MTCSYLRLAAVGVVALFLAGCVSAKGLLDDPLSTQIVAVQVTKAQPDMGSVNLAEDLRAKTLNAAYRFSETGSPKQLNLHITQISFKDPLQSLLVGSTDMMQVKVEMVDPASGSVDQQFDNVVIANGEVNGMLGAVVSIVSNPLEQEQVLATLTANSILTRIYGRDHAAKVAKRTPSRMETPNYPANYDDLKKERACRFEAGHAARVAQTERGGFGGQSKLPDC